MTWHGAVCLMSNTATKQLNELITSSQLVCGVAWQSRSKLWWWLCRVAAYLRLLLYSLAHIRRRYFMGFNPCPLVKWLTPMKSLGTCVRCPKFYGSHNPGHGIFSTTSIAALRYRKVLTLLHDRAPSLELDLTARIFIQKAILQFCIRCAAKQFCGSKQLNQINWMFTVTSQMLQSVLSVQVLEDRWILYVVRHWVLMVSASQSLPYRLFQRVVNQRLFRTLNQVHLWYNSCDEKTDKLLLLCKERQHELPSVISAVLCLHMHII